METFPDLDSSAFGELRKRMGDELLSKMIVRFLQTAPGKVEKARSAHAEGDLAKLERAAHSLVSGAGTLGAEGFVKLAKQIERSAGEEKGRECSALLSKLECSFQRLQKRLRSELDKLSV